MWTIRRISKKKRKNLPGGWSEERMTRKERREKCKWKNSEVEKRRSKLLSQWRDKNGKRRRRDTFPNSSPLGLIARKADESAFLWTFVYRKKHWLKARERVNVDFLLPPSSLSNCVHLVKGKQEKRKNELKRLNLRHRENLLSPHENGFPFVIREWMGERSNEDGEDDDHFLFVCCVCICSFLSLWITSTFTMPFSRDDADVMCMWFTGLWTWRVHIAHFWLFKMLQCDTLSPRLSLLSEEGWETTEKRVHRDWFTFDNVSLRRVSLVQFSPVV